MTKFSGHTAHPVPNAPSQNETPTDTSTQSKHPHIVESPRSAEPLLPEGGGVRVIFQNDACAQPFLDFSASGIVGPIRQVGRLANHAGRHVDNPGHANADPA